MEVQQRNSTKIYSLSTGPNLPEWLGEQARRNLSKRDSSIRRRLELLQDFSMPTSSSKLLQTSDGQYILASGIYSPRIKCYELSELSMKFERYIDAEVVDMISLSSNYGKIALLRNDRTLSFHAPYGHHHNIRIPRFGRAMAYECTTCELYVACSPKGRDTTSSTSTNTNNSTNNNGGELYRINLEEGRFSTPLSFSSSNNTAIGGSSISISPTHALTALGCDDGTVRFWDNRSSSSMDTLNLSPLCQLNIELSTKGYGFHNPQSYEYSNVKPSEVTSIAFDTSGMYLAAGTHSGNVALFDIRSSKPLHVKEHQYGMPIHTLRFHSGSGSILSSDKKIVKIWRFKPSPTSTDEYDKDSLLTSNFTSSNDKSSSVGSIVSNIEGTSDFNHFIVAGDDKESSGNSSGLILCATEQPKMQAFYCPILGSAPRWCSFLDNITEELEETSHLPSSTNNTADDIIGGGTSTIYEDYKFLTRSEIDTLGIQDLVGTPLLRGYMHGFFINITLYNKIRAVLNPFEYDEYRKKKLREKMEERQASRIAPKQSSTSKKKDGNKGVVNVELANRLESKMMESTRKKSSLMAKSLLEDDRFGSLFRNPDYEIDEEDINFKLRNPSGVANINKAMLKKKDDMDSDNDDEISNDNDEDWGNDNDDKNYHNDSDSNHSDSDGDEDGIIGGKVRGENYEEIKSLERQMKHQKGHKGKGNLTKRDNINKYDDPVTKKNKKQKRSIQMTELDNDNNLSKVSLLKKRNDSAAHQNHKNLSIQDRLQQHKAQEIETNGNDNMILGQTRLVNVKGEGMTREFTYIPQDTGRKTSKNKNDNDDDDNNLLDGGDGIVSKRNRRGVKELGLKKIKQ